MPPVAFFRVPWTLIDVYTPDFLEAPWVRPREARLELLHAPAYPDVRSAFAMLRRAGVRVGVLSDDPPWTRQQLTNAGVGDLVDFGLVGPFSSDCERVRAVYEGLAESVGADASSTWAVAVDSWFVGCAVVAGWRGAHVHRGSDHYETWRFPEPHVAGTLTDVIRHIAAMHRPG